MAPSRHCCLGAFFPCTTIALAVAVTREPLIFAARSLAAFTATPAGEKVPAIVVFDTTCPDCRKWALTQLQPLWKDQEFRQSLKSSYDLQFLATSVTRHEQGPLLNNLLNCAHSSLEIDQFLNSIFCWEEKVEAWAPIPGSNKTQQSLVDVDDLLASCFPADSLQCLKECASDGAKRKPIDDHVALKMPSDVDEVPWLVIGGNTFSMGGDDRAVYHLKDYLCEQMRGVRPPSSCRRLELLSGTDYVDPLFDGGEKVA
mmetsp:Transcript_81974/g.228496  ORF Transcript_81974/g.228496 Transcript_81974/m.228496 type:complete len:257 (+) Transcript_81974:113-883(+)